jgi:hypothetical protein
MKIMAILHVTIGGSGVRSNRHTLGTGTERKRQALPTK